MVLIPHTLFMQGMTLSHHLGLPLTSAFGAQEHPLLPFPHQNQLLHEHQQAPGKHTLELLQLLAALQGRGKDMGQQVQRHVVLGAFTNQDKAYKAPSCKPYMVEGADHQPQAP